jgi:hypothetical protein
VLDGAETGFLVALVSSRSSSLRAWLGGGAFGQLPNSLRWVAKPRRERLYLGASGVHRQMWLPRVESITARRMPMKNKITVLDDYQSVAPESEAAGQSANVLRRSLRLHRPARDKTPGVL